MYYKVCIHNLLCPLPGVYVFDLEQIFPIPEQDLCVRTFYNLQLLDEHHEPSCCKVVAFLVA